MFGSTETDPPGLRVVGSGDGVSEFGFSVREDRIAHGRAIGGLVSAHVILVVVRGSLDIERVW